MNTPTIRVGYAPGLIGRVSELHGQYYHQHWGFGLEFEAKVASELAAFLQRYDAARDCIWSALEGDRIQAAITIDGIAANTHGAHLRWFIVSESLHGRGVGKLLLDGAVAFARAHRYKRTYLWTFEGLHAARHLYESVGFKLTESRIGRQWGKEVREQRFELRFPVKQA